MICLKACLNYAQTNFVSNLIARFSNRKQDSKSNFLDPLKFYLKASQNCFNSSFEENLEDKKMTKSTEIPEEIRKELLELRKENENLKKSIIERSSTANQLSLEEFRRYGRQMLVPEFGGVDSQIALKNSKVLVVGAGGLGCPALLYLTASGVGTIGIIDYDTVDITNLHRQVLHSTDQVGNFKVDSAKSYLSSLNPNVNLITYREFLTNFNAFEVIEKYDLILDCTDTPMLRYLINDASVLLGKTIVSGSGLKTEGQLSVLNFKNSGPCYRCFYPKPPPANSVTSCQDGGVIGPCIGLVGTMMAVEAIKVLANSYTLENFKPFLTIYSGYSAVSQSLRTFKMRGKKLNCEVCGENPLISKDTIQSGLLDYNLFCGHPDYDVVGPEERISVSDYNKNIIQNKIDHLLLDVRPNVHWNISNLKGSIHIPLEVLNSMISIDQLAEKINSSSRDNSGNQQITNEDLIHKKIYCICRFGNDSRLATKLLKDRFKLTEVWDIIGGLKDWSEEIDSSFPRYW
ncbi:Uba4p ASCRUDRAFT_135192 [Ascoidea rubescens DSM 1968]|uniref:Needs CLA4 to survive protein 3 n=1 Tax=Ascoidea rubescens DSM 1968 TaxID=1344418 RepID=A0A1D2VLI1_9ASCO|nr:hypothetical protein ASCRUDRAFT_135192 [Ascoidea rubescens DSM 1968]ODV62453.1 hypothetical protein ASCRUDRAFT_135192 [Ascoidea rubescens DSM 1968]